MQERLPMKWTTDKPTEPGKHYWIKMPGHDRTIGLIDDTGFVKMIHWDSWVYLEAISKGTEFYGPIEEPTND